MKGGGGQVNFDVTGGYTKIEGTGRNVPEAVSR